MERKLQKAKLKIILFQYPAVGLRNPALVWTSSFKILTLFSAIPIKFETISKVSMGLAKMISRIENINKIIAPCERPLMNDK